MFIKKEISKDIISLATPVVIATISRTLINLLDTAFLVRLPNEEAICSLAGVGVGIIFLWVIGGFFNAIGVGTQAVVARRIGEEKTEEAGFPKMGAKGAGIAATSASFIGAIYMISVSLSSSFLSMKWARIRL